jgi:manganese/iron transport system permease protein/iron/zinc/copper transport system permease protein
MNYVSQLLLEPLHDVGIQKAIIGGSLVAVVCGVIGCFVILRRMAFLGDALSHAMLAGVVSGYLFMQIVFGVEAHVPAMLIGSIVAGLVTVGMIGFVSKVSRIKDDTAIGIMYTGIFALGGILASVFSHRIHLHIYDFIVGMVLGVKDSQLWLMAIVAAFVLAVVILLFRQLQITTFDPVMAASIGIPVIAIDYLLTTCTSLVVVAAVSVVGIILVVGLLVTPAATAYLLCDRLSRMLLLSAVFGVTSVVGGIYISTWIGNVATGPSIVAVGTLQFLAVLMLAPRYGLLADWLRRRQMVPQQLVEDVLGCVLRAPGTTVSIQTVVQHVEGRHEQIRRAIRSLERQELLLVSDSQITLTESGDREARRLLRAHRLWESYLAHVGTPAEQLHQRAHRLEHLHDQRTVDYLDDKLGHPLRDPHGSEIPEDFVQVVPGAEVKASMLRRGHRGTITSIGPAAENSPLRVGMEITTGPRKQDGTRWSIILPNRQELLLDHPTADAVTVKLTTDDHPSRPS